MLEQKYVLSLSGSGYCYFAFKDKYTENRLRYQTTHELNLVLTSKQGYCVQQNLIQYWSTRYAYHGLFIEKVNTSICTGDPCVTRLKYMHAHVLL